MPASPAFTATRSQHGKTTRVTIRDSKGTVTDTRNSKTMRYVEVLLTPGGKINTCSQTVGGTPRKARDGSPITAGWSHVAVTEATAAVIQTSPGVWSVPNSTETFSTEAAARAYIDAQATGAGLVGSILAVARAHAKDAGPADVAAERRARAYADARIAEAPESATSAPAKPAAKPAPAKAKPAAKPPRAAAVKTADMKLDDLLPEGAVTDSPKSGAYTRVRVAGKPVGYVTPRRGGDRLVEVLTTRIAGAPAPLLAGTSTRQNQTALLVTDKATATQARKLFALAAASLEVK